MNIPLKLAGIVFFVFGVTVLLGDEADSFSKAMKLYDAKEYKKSYQAFKKLFFDDMTNQKTNIYLARSAYEAGYYNDSVAAYERVLFTEPDNLMARVELGRAYFTMRLYEQAEIEFTSVLIHPIPPEIRKTIESYMKKIEESKQKHLLAGMLTVAAQDDTNVNNGNSYTDIYPNPPVSDSSLIENVMLLHTYNMTDRDYYWITKASIYAQQHYKENDYNILYPNVETGLQYRSKNYLWTFPISIDTLTYAGVNRFSSLGVAAQYDRLLSADESYSLKAKVIERRYVQNMDDGRDSRIVEIDGRWQKNNSDTIYSAYANVAQEKANEDIRDDVDNTTVRLGVGYYKKFFEKTAASFNYNLRNRKNREETNDGSSTSIRNDITHTLGCALIDELDKRSYLSLYFNYTKNTTNQKIFEYDKRVFGVSYTLNFDHDWITNHPHWKGDDK